MSYEADEENAYMRRRPWIATIEGSVAGIAFEFVINQPEDFTLAAWESFARGEQDLDFRYGYAHIKNGQVELRALHCGNSDVDLYAGGAIEDDWDSVVWVPVSLLTRPLLGMLHRAAGAGMTFACDWGRRRRGAAA